MGVVHTEVPLRKVSWSANGKCKVNNSQINMLFNFFFNLSIVGICNITSIMLALGV